MADKTRFLITSKLDTATITSNSEATGLPDDNVVNSLVRKVWRTTGDSSEWIKFDLGSAQTINCFFIFNHNLTSAATVNIQANATDTWGSPSVNVSATIVVDDYSNVYPKIGYFWTASQNYQWWRVLIADAANPATYIQVGRMMAGIYTEPTQNLSDGFSVRTIDPSRVTNTVGRQGYWTTRTKYQELTYQVRHAGQTQVDQFYSIYNEVGKHTPFVMALMPETRPTKDTYYVQFDGDTNFSHRLITDYDISDITFQEKT